jgi:dUTP pyrophosphatase
MYFTQSATIKTELFNTSAPYIKVKMFAVLLCIALGAYIYILKQNKPIEIKLECMDDVKLPSVATRGSACVDLCAHLPKKPVRVKPGEIKKIPTGIAMHIPRDMEVVVRSRSGLSLKGIVVANSPGTIDSDYRKEIFVILQNIGSENFIVPNGMRIAQAGARRLPEVRWRIVSKIEKTSRGGFGSTGL